MIVVRVECYSGYKADERPVRVHLGERSLMVKEVQDKWYSPGVTYFRLKAEDNNVYILKHEEAQDVWILEAFRSQIPGE